MASFHPSPSQQNDSRCLEIETHVQVNTKENMNRLKNDEPERDGLCLTWEDLWVTVSKGKMGGKPILQGISGYAKTGELLAIMGPSGCGKSTLLDALAGRLSSNTRQSGDILINGQKQTLSYGTSAYVMQDDTLITTLTVEEAVYYSAQLQLPSSMTKLEKMERAYVTIKEMGLQDAINTRIGGWGSKGLSGGQKRRLSICLEILTRPKLLFLDEPTSGLDSASSYYVMSRIASLDQRDGVGRTIITSIHQPSSEVFQLFHNLCLLSSGRTVYFGPRSEANHFFALNGFPCPSLQNPSDHYLKTINKDFKEDMEQGQHGIMRAEEAIDTLVKSYYSSSIHKEVQTSIAKICSKDNKESIKQRSRASFITQCIVLTKRSSLNMFRDWGYYWLRFIIYIILAFGLGSIYYDIGSTYGSIKARGGLIMFAATYLTFMAIGGFPSFVEDMKVFKRERLNGHYFTTAFVLSNTFSSISYLMLISIIPGAITYFLAGLHSGFEHFLYFALVLFACMMLVEGLMMIVASVVPNFLMGIITGAGLQGFMMLGGGFFRLPNDLPGPFWRYPLYYISFHKYAYQGMYKNEFEGLTFPGQQGGLPNVSGDQILRQTWQVEMEYSKWVDLAILMGMVVLYRVMFLAIIKINEVVMPVVIAIMSVPPKQAMQVRETPSFEQVEGDNL